MYRFKSLDKGEHRVQLLGSGTILREVIAAQQILADDWDVGSDVWSCTSFTELRRDGLDCEREALLNPEDPAPTPYVTDRKSTRLNSSHVAISYAVFCLKK